MTDNMAKQPDDGRPNILLVVVDDMGYSDCQPFGGEIRTPTLQALSERGARLRNFHTSSLCAPTRAMLLSGVDNHQNGLGIMPPFHTANQFGKPGYEGPLNRNAATIAELLRDAGYHTYMTGKWHLGHNDGYRPAQRGFEKSSPSWAAAPAISTTCCHCRATKPRIRAIATKTAT